jgi:hypothetical protein
MPVESKESPREQVSRLRASDVKVDLCCLD